MKLKITIPEDLNDITIGQYQTYITVSETMNETEKAYFLVSLFCDIDKEYVGKMAYNDFVEVSNAIKKSFESKPKFQNKFELNGITYGFIPNLDEMSFGEYLDANNYVSDISNLHRLMAVLYRPVTDKKGDVYNIEDYEGSGKYSTVFEQAPLGVILGAKVFFYNLGRDLLSCILEFSKTQKYQMEDSKIIQLKEFLKKNMDGMELFTRSLAETY